MAKRKIVSIDEEKCTGCGLCVPNCAEGALQIINGKARLVKEIYCDGLGACLGHCPEGAISIEEREAGGFDKEATKAYLEGIKKEKVSELTNWPVQLRLVPAEAPYLKNADLLIAADCVAFSCPDFHRDLLKGKTLIIGCPKLDEADLYIKKLAEIFKLNNLKGITVAHMEVPCCFGLNHIVNEALKLSGLKIPVKEITVGIQGNIGG